MDCSARRPRGGVERQNSASGFSRKKVRASFSNCDIMKIIIEKIKQNPLSLLRRAGYVFQRNEGLEISLVRPLARSGYPRFHIYASVKDFDLIINIHLDQKKETYGNSTRHHGEYENNEPLKNEIARIKSILGDQQ
jgi:hypothetical protein